MLVSLLRTYLRPYSKLIALVVALQLVQSVATLYLPFLNADVIDNGIVKGDTGYITNVGGLMIAVSLGQVLSAIAAFILGSRAALAAGRDIRLAVFDKVQDFSGREMARFGPASLITRTTNDVQQVQMLALMGLTLVVTAPMMALGGIALALNEDVPLSGILVVSVVVLGIAVSLIISRMRPFYRLMQQRIDRISRLVRDQIIGVRVIRAFVRDRGERERFEKASEELFEVSLGAGRTMAYLFPTMMLTVNLSTVAVIWFGGHRIDNGGLQVGALAAFIGYLLQILTAVMVSSLLFVMVPRSEVCAGRIREVLDAEPGTPPPSEPVTPLAPVGELTFDDVEFRYPGAEEPVLRGINLTARVGQITAIVGGTGSGKTTLLSLIPRLFDVTGGSVRIGGVDVRELDPAALSGLVAMVPQQPYLFAGTIASNLRYGRPEATETEIWQALETAQAADFVRESPERLDAPIAQGGSTVSGGQRQRLTIARAILHRPRILLFDDSFSALDYATAAALNSALAQETQDRIVFVVAQRINLIRDADQIVVLDGGRIVATGTHTELMETCETYQEIARSQLTETEVL